MIKMKTKFTYGKNNLLCNFSKMRIKIPSRLFSQNKENGIIREKDNFCFTKENILSENYSDLNDQKVYNIDNDELKNKMIQKILATNINQIVIIEKENTFQGNIAKVKRVYKDVMELTKFRLCVLNTIVAVSTFAFYSSAAHLFIDFALFTGGTLCISMTTQVINQIVEKYHDKKMRRTCSRPLPSQRMTDRTASIIGAVLWLSSSALYSMTCPHAILFSNAILLLYIGAYTPLKRYSNLSTHIGAVVGGLPALLGSFSATGLLMQESSLLLAVYIYAWQYPHFYGIFYQNKEDYKKSWI